MNERENDWKGLEKRNSHHERKGITNRKNPKTDCTMNSTFS